MPARPQILQPDERATYSIVTDHGELRAEYVTRDRGGGEDPETAQSLAIVSM